MMLEHGWGAGLVATLKILLPSAVFYLHQNKCMVNSMVTSLRTGKAAYVNTGRPDPFDHYSTTTMYICYAQSHYYPALEKLVLYIFYTKFTGNSGTLPMFLTFSIIFGWIFSPVYFCPQIEDLQVVKQDIFEVGNFLFTVIDKKDSHKAENSMDKMWRKKDQEFHHIDSCKTRILWWCMKAIPVACLFLMSFAVFFDYCVLYLFMWIWHVCFTLAFMWSNYSNMFSFIWMLMPLILSYVITYGTPQRSPTSVEAIFGLFMFIHMLRLIHHLILILASGICKCRRNCSKTEKDKGRINKQYKDFIDFCFFIFFQYHVHLYAGVLVCVFQSLFELCMMVLFALRKYFVSSWKNAMLRSRSLKESKWFGGAGIKVE